MIKVLFIAAAEKHLMEQVHKVLVIALLMLYFLVLIIVHHLTQEKKKRLRILGNLERSVRSVKPEIFIKL